MSLWDRYLAPGDLRARQQQLAPPPPPTPSEEARPANERLAAPSQRITANKRQIRQDSLLYGGALFTLLSLLVTRRSLKRKALPFPQTFSPSNAPPANKGDGALDAAEALGLATLTTFSLAMLGAGVVAKGYDIADIEDLRDGVRRGVGFDVYGGDSAADREVEGWIAEVLSRRDGEGGLQESIALKLKELEEMEKKGGGGKR